MFKNNLLKLRQKMKEDNIDLAVITDDDSLYYFTGYYNFLHMDFARPTILLVPKDNDSTLITPLLDVLLIEDIVDSGNTIKYIKEHFKGFNIKSLSVLALFVRSQSKKQVDWFLYEIKNNKYIIGYGMDCNNLFRDLKDIYIENNARQRRTLYYK